MSQDEIFARAFAQILTDCFYGVPLLDPLNSDDAQIGDVGYIQNGRFKKLFSGAVPRPPPISPFSSVQKTDIPPTSISEKAGGSIYGAPQPEAFSDMIATVLHNWAVNMAWHHRYTLPRELYS